MKNSLVIGLLCLGIGFGAAWIIKSASDKATTESPDTKKSSGPSTSAQDEIAKSDRPAPETPAPETNRKIVNNGEEVPLPEEVRAQFTRGQDRFREMIARRQKSKEDAQIKKLVDRLGLTDTQADQLRAYFAKNREELEALMADGDGDWRKMRELTKSLGDDALDAALADILTDDQKTAYEEMKQRDLANKVEARAYRDLATIQGILDLNPEQKDQVYEILHKDAAQRVESNREANAIVTTITEGLGLDINPEDLGIGFSGAIQSFVNRAEDGEQPSEDRGEILQAMRDNRQQEIDNKVELLAPVLDDGQEDAYRTHLETRGGGLFGGLLQGGGISVESTEIDIPPAPAPAPESE
ncbi:MAG: Spy/CpxP family protein refolding chaperone [Roseibacillus sp.]